MVTAPVETFQNQWELDQMLAVVERLQPSRILEVGSWHGGTLWHWLRFADVVVAIDDEMRMGDTWKVWAKRVGAELHLIQGMSQDAEVIAAASEHAPYDFIFIDADHRYEAVKADWLNFREMVSLGGVLAFHDTRHIGDDTYGVEQLFDEITSEPDARWMHIVMTDHCGIGLVWL